MTQTLKEIFSIRNLTQAYNKSREKSCSSSNVCKKIVSELHFKIVNNLYKANKLSFFTLTKSNGKERVIYKCSVHDSLVQRALLDYFNKKLNQLGLNNDHVYGIKGKSVKSAIDQSVKKRNKKPWVLKTDITAFFDNIDRKILEEMLIKKKQITKHLLPILTQIINTEVETKFKAEKDRLKSNGIEKGKGLRQGMPLSPLLASFFLSSFDKKIAKKELDIIRYADDIIFFGSTEEECKKYEKFITKNLKTIGLNIAQSDKGSKTQIYSPEEPVLFLGIEIYKCKNNPRYQHKIPKKKFNEAIDELDNYSTFDKSKRQLINKKIKKFTLKLILEKLKSIVDGYSAAYKGTSNYQAFSNKLNKKLQEVQNNLLVSVLGKDVLNNLDQEKKQFLGFDL